MNLLVIGDNHGDIENMITYLEKIENFNIDLIVYMGDFTDLNTPKGFTQEDITNIIIEEMKSLDKPILAIPGNNDTKETVDILEKNNISIHGKGKEIGRYGFYGFGGAKTPFSTPFEPSEEELERGLETAYSDVKNTKYKIQVTHNPPFNTEMDIIRSGAHVGSEVVRNFIREKKPLLALSAHIHESKGTGKLGKTYLLNPGKFPEGYFGLISLEDGVIKSRVLNLCN